MMRVFFNPWEAEVEVCKARMKTPREKTTSNGHGKLKASEAESMGKPYLVANFP